MSAGALEQEIRLAGGTCRVEAFGRVAILMPDAAFRPDSAERRRLVAMARRHGFASICLELAPEHAPLSGA
jgi:hypothetical protein